MRMNRASRDPVREFDSRRCIKERKVISSSAKSSNHISEFLT